MKKNIFASILLILSVLLVSACGNTKDTNGDEVVVLKFKENMSPKKVEELNGKKVQMTGFMATTSPLDGKYVYLMNMPYHKTPYCIPNTNQLANTLTVYSTKDKSFDFVDLPITVTGTFKSGDEVDSLGYASTYRLVDASYSTANVDGLEKAIKEYTALVSKGFVQEYISALTEVYKLVYESRGVPESKLTPIDVTRIGKIKGMFSGLDASEYADVIKAVDDLDNLVITMNKTIKDKEYNTLVTYEERAQSCFSQLNLWLMKPNL
ncbi:hypothetical protein [Paenibacillus planticolens]|uniref:Lipoprotein n=1 Tax=Paenibacillus planticolens TaxID=2654976 RepID=A0ABX1ZRG0_9BACL|nr:hypothetical protein [Paenibacillus planticolens]NOV01507.1 hypothetical protein [Paenibacillus planticolens]